jgi:hypothetical protein
MRSFFRIILWRVSKYSRASRLCVIMRWGHYQTLLSPIVHFSINRSVAESETENGPDLNSDSTHQQEEWIRSLNYTKVFF